MRLSPGLLVVASVLVISAARADDPPMGHRPFDAQPDAPPAPAVPAAPAVASILAPIPARLDYSRGPGAEACPDEEAVRAAVAANVGRDPFVATAPRRLVARIAREGRGFMAYLEIREDSGAVSWTHPPMPNADCRGLVRAAALSIAIKLDPNPAPAFPAAPAPPPPVIVAAPPGSAPPIGPEAPASVPASSSRPRFHAGLGAAFDFGLLPAPAAALDLALGVRWPHFSLSAEARGLLPVSIDVVPPPGSGSVAAARVRTWAFTGSIVPCGHILLPVDKWNVEACAMVTLGAAHAEPISFAAPLGGTALLAATGLRAGIEFPVGGPVLLRIGADLLGVIRPVRLHLHTNDAEVWTGGRLAGSAGGGVLADF